jgi:hypothetical protein
MFRKISSHVSRHLRKWKDFYEVLGILLATIVSFLSLKESHEAIALTRESVSIQEQDYEVRNRPYVIFSFPVFGGPITSTSGELSPQSIKFEIRNISDIPARKVQSIGIIYVDGKSISTTYLNEVAIGKDVPLTQSFNIPGAFVSTITNSTTILTIEITTKYYGMFEQKAPYETNVKYRYYPIDQTFGQSKLEIK